MLPDVASYDLSKIYRITCLNPFKNKFDELNQFSFFVLLYHQTDY